MSFAGQRAEQRPRAGSHPRGRCEQPGLRARTRHRAAGQQGFGECKGSASQCG